MVHHPLSSLKMFLMSASIRFKLSREDIVYWKEAKGYVMHEKNFNEEDKNNLLLKVK